MFSHSSVRINIKMPIVKLRGLINKRICLRYCRSRDVVGVLSLSFRGHAVPNRRDDGGGDVGPRVMSQSATNLVSDGLE